jgi:LysM repeat protein
MAGKAAPAAAIASILVAGPAHAAVAAPVTTVAVAGPIHTDALVSHHQASRTYVVQPGDTLSSISQRIYGTPADALWIYRVNMSKIRNPNLIYPGQVLSIPYGPPAGAATAAPEVAHEAMATASVALSGTLGCTGLEELWQEAGGGQGEAFMAAEIAMAESSGQQYATGGVGERGYWQINPNHGSLSTYDPLGNAKAAVIISADGTNWTPWTTYTSGAYLGRC